MEAKSSKFNLVMVIDDMSVDLFITTKLISVYGFTRKFLSFPRAKDGLQYLVKHQNDNLLLPEIIFVDMTMPDMSGFGFLEEYDKLHPWVKDHCAVFILSSSIDVKELERARRNRNVTGLFEKPITVQQLDAIPALAHRNPRT